MPWDQRPESSTTLCSGGGTSRTSDTCRCLVEITRKRHQGRSLLSTMDLFVMVGNCMTRFIIVRSPERTEITTCGGISYRCHLAMPLANDTCCDLLDVANLLDCRHETSVNSSENFTYMFHFSPSAQSDNKFLLCPHRQHAQGFWPNGRPSVRPSVCLSVCLSVCPVF